MTNLINLMILCGLSASVYYLSNKSNLVLFILMWLLELVSVVFVLHHQLWYGRMLNVMNIFNWFLVNRVHETFSLVLSGVITYGASLMLFIAPMCSKYFDNKVTNHQNKGDH